jgi:predicted nucleic acid-binding protein
LSYLLDTDAASYLMERRYSIVAKVREVGGPVLLSISTITLAEPYYGVRTMPEGRRKTRRLDDLRRMLEAGMDIRPFSVDAARVYAETGATLQIAGISVKGQDLAIASNDRFFGHVQRLCGLRFERSEP